MKALHSAACKLQRVLIPPKLITESVQCFIGEISSLLIGWDFCSEHDILFFCCPSVNFLVCPSKNVLPWWKHPQIFPQQSPEWFSSQSIAARWERPPGAALESSRPWALISQNNNCPQVSFQPQMGACYLRQVLFTLSYATADLTQWPLFRSVVHSC